MARKKATGILVYNLLLKEVTKINKHLPENRKMSLAERRELISRKIYPKYKGRSRSTIRLTPLRDKLYTTIRRMPAKQGCDILAIPPQTYQDKPYYEIEQFIESILPKCIYVKVNAGSYGQTTIFNTRDFNYYSMGLAEITNRINEDVRKRNLKSSGVPDYNGSINVRPGKKNDGTSDNYYLEMILTGMRIPAPRISIPFKKKTKKQLKAEANVKEFIRSRLKTMRQEGSVFKKIRKDISSSLALIKSTKKSKHLTREQKKQIAEKIYSSLRAKVEEHHKSGILTDKKYQSIIRQINRQEKGKNKNS